MAQLDSGNNSDDVDYWTDNEYSTDDLEKTGTHLIIFTNLKIGLTMSNLLKT